VRRLWALTSWLPPGSAYHRSLELNHAATTPVNGTSLTAFAQKFSAYTETA
jgi:hypothetical protein